MTLEQIQQLSGKTIILRRKQFIGEPFYDREVKVELVLDKSVLVKSKTIRKAFVPKAFFLEERATFETETEKAIVYLPHWFSA